MKSSMLDTLMKAEQVKPIAIKDGLKIVTFEDSVILAQGELIEDKVDMGERMMNPNGTVARSKRHFAAINLESLFNNRYRSLRGGKIQVVTDYRAIKEQDTGRIYAKRIVCYEISRDKETKQLVLDKIINVSDDEFISDFTHKLNINGMMEIMPLINSGNKAISTDDLTI